jgi:hypothetical protein
MWKAIYGFSKYEANDKGEIRNKQSKRILKPYSNRKNGYLQVRVSNDNNESVTRKVHVLILMAFNPIDKKDGLEINHIDGNKLNNSIDNLEWCTHSANMLHAWQKGLNCGRRVKVICLDNLQIYNSYQEAGLSIGSYDGSHIKQVCDGKRGHCKGKHFARLEDYENNCIPLFKDNRIKQIKNA